MARVAILTAVSAAVLAGPIRADCPPAGFGSALPETMLTAPVLPDPTSRPVLPECLSGLSDPIQQNCSTEEIEAYSAAIAAYSTALQAYVEATNRFANDAVRFANAASDFAGEARRYADSALDWARCEVDEINRAADQGR